MRARWCLRTRNHLVSTSKWSLSGPPSCGPLLRLGSRVVADLEQLLRRQNRFMIGFDLVLGTGALLAPDQTLAVLGHREPSDDARELFRRCAPIWFTFAAAHATAAARDDKRDWWALAWLRGTEIATDALWARSSAFTRPGARAGLWFAGAANLAMALGFGRLGR
jgi:hypothetical protein